MNDKIIGWIAAAIICFSAGWLHRAHLSDFQNKAVVVGCLVVAASYRHFSLRAARTTALNRRRFFKELARRVESSKRQLNQNEEQLLMLLGRLKGGKSMRWVMIGGCITALNFKIPVLPLVFAVSEGFFALMLHRFVRGIESKNAAVQPDHQRAKLPVALPASHSGRYLLNVNMAAVRDFLPPASLAVWSAFFGPYRWLSKCGFTQHSFELSRDNNQWIGDRAAIMVLDPDEILSIAASPR